MLASLQISNDVLPLELLQLPIGVEGPLSELRIQNLKIPKVQTFHIWIIWYDLYNLKKNDSLDDCRTFGFETLSKCLSAVY